MHWKGKRHDEPTTRLEAYTRAQGIFDRLIAKFDCIVLILPYMREALKKEAEVFDCRPCRQVLQTLAENFDSLRKMAWNALFTMSYIDDVDPWGDPSTPETRHAEWQKKAERIRERKNERRKNPNRVSRSLCHGRKRKVRGRRKDVCGNED